MSPLPTPVEAPDAEVVIYDGQCRFCTNQVRRLNRWDGQNRLAFLSLHDPIVAERYPDLTHDQLMAELFLIDRNGHRHGGAAAFRVISRRLPCLWPLVPLMHLPGSLPIWKWMYRQIARQRYRWGKVPACDDGQCDIHF